MTICQRHDSVRVAALYVDARGPYWTMPGVDPWDVRRDATRYGLQSWDTSPVVAHPDCGPWGKLRHMYKGSNHAHAPRAIEQVRRFGGVLEHPAHSRLWSPVHGVVLPLPGAPADAWGGVTIAVNQSDWGHVARKPTWLYLVRVPAWLVRAYHAPFPGRPPTHWIGGGRNIAYANRAQRGKIPVGIKCASAEQRRRTPPAFAQYLVTLARSTRWQ